jgi:uncharacterized protein YecT (DUF1311 family)
MKTLLLILSLILPLTLLYPQGWTDGYTYFKNSDKKLNYIYQELIVTSQSDTTFIKNLRVSQRIWIKFRDAQLTLMFPEHASIEKMNLLSSNELLYLAHLTEDRTKVLSELLKPATNKMVYVSNLEIIHSGNIHGGIGIDKPYWTNELVICGKRYSKGLIMHPESGGIVAYAEFLLPQKGGHIIGVAGYAEGEGSVTYNGKMRYRIFVDGELLYGNELIGKECRGIDLDLGTGRVLRIETDDGNDGNYSDQIAFGDLRIVYSQKTTEIVANVDFHIPKGWKEINDTTFILKNFIENFDYWNKFLSSGHQPWRYDAKNCAAVCLQEFGIKYPSDISNFAKQINEIKTGRVYSYKVNKQSYIVYIRKKDKIPIAHRLDIRK